MIYIGYTFLSRPEIIGERFSYLRLSMNFDRIL